VVNVSWHDAVAYANWLSERLGRTPVYQQAGDTVIFNSGVNGFRLPTEAEWEYAARGGEQGAKDGFVYAGSNEIDEVAWYYDNCATPDGIRRTRGVYDTKRPNQLGLLHLSGNVWEWCWDWYGDYPANPAKDYAGPEEGSFRVRRGGSWGRGARGCRASLRGYSTPGNRSRNIGFRLASAPQCGGLPDRPSIER
jgi:formylglycine-generating enzyme required for sulfatase activity